MHVENERQNGNMPYTTEDLIQENEPLREQVANIVRRKIIRQEFKSGERLSERAISKMLHVSTTPVKEAFRILVTEGLMITIPNKGSFVSEYSMENLKGIIYMRAALEGTITHFATEYITPEEIVKMDEALARAYACIESMDAEGGIQADADFHNSIRYACRNQYLINMLHTLRTIDHSVRSLPLYRQDKEERLLTHSQHCAIAAAIKAGDADLAEALMIKHIRQVNEFPLKSGNK